MDQTYNSVFASLPYGACLVDREGRVVACNPALERLLGWSPGERQGQPLSAYLRQVAEPAEALAWAVALGNALGGGQTTFLNLPARLQAGPDATQGVSIVGVVAPWQGLQGEPLGAMALFQDSEQSESVEGARLRFLSMVAHELNSPLNIILSAAEQMGCHHDQDGAATERFLDVIRAEVDRMQRLLGSLFTPEPLPVGSPSWEAEAVALGPVLHRLAERYRFTQQAGQISVEAPPDLPLAHADACALQEALGSLVDTFLAYAPPRSQMRFLAAEEAGDLMVRVHLSNAALPPNVSGEEQGPAPWECRFGFSLPRAQAEGEGGSEDA
jgi:signal transduction histidine kinase